MERVPMVHRKLLANVPGLDRPFAFDMEVGDWIAPEGRGIRADFLVKASKRFVSPEDMEIGVAVTFTNRGDGIQTFSSSSFIPYVVKSVLPPPQTAPVDGYGGEWIARISRAPGQQLVTSYAADRGLMFRIRTVMDDRGEIRQANYGWMNGEIKVGGYDSRPVSMALDYYLNPNPQSRSLEPERID